MKQGVLPLHYWEEPRKLKQLLAKATLDNHALRDPLRKDV